MTAPMPADQQQPQQPRVPTPQELRKLTENATLITQELARRRANDALFQFKPYPKQREFIDAVLKGSVSHVWFLAANRSGKSDAGAYCGAQLARFGVDPLGAGAVSSGGAIVVRDRATSGWVSALDFPTSRDTIQPKYFDNGFVPPGATHRPFIPEHEIERWDVEAQVLKLRSGSIIGFKSADSGRLKYQGAEKDWIHFDEAHPKDIYDEALIRVGARVLRFFCTATILPEKGGEHVAWVYSEIIEPYFKKQLPDMLLFNASIYDNPHLDAGEVEKLERRYTTGSIQARIRLDGELLSGLVGSRVYTSYQSRLHVRTAPVIAPRVPLSWAWDFNVSPMVSLVGQRIQRVFYVHREFFMEEGSIPEMCDAYYNTFGSHPGAVWIYGDASGKDRSAQSRKSDYQIILNHMRQYSLPMVLKVPEKNPPIADRINALNQALIGMDGEISLLIDPGCEELSKDLDQVIYGKNNKIKKVTNRSDPQFFRTHISDALGYWVCYEAPVKPAIDPRRNIANPLAPGVIALGNAGIKRPGYAATGSPARSATIGIGGNSGITIGGRLPLAPR